MVNHNEFVAVCTKYSHNVHLLTSRGIKDMIWDNFARTDLLSYYIAYFSVLCIFSCVFARVFICTPWSIKKRATLFLTITPMFHGRITKFLRATAGTAIARLSHRNSVCLSVRPSVCHTGGSGKNGAS